MVITNDFVFIHFPKNAGSFVTECIYNLYDGTADKNRNRSFTDHWTKLINKEKTNYSYKHFSKALEFNGEKMRTQHQGCDHIPAEHRGKEIISAIRNPYDRYVSLYKYAWWKRHPVLPLEKLKALYPTFPEITFEQYLDLVLNHNIEVTKAKNNITLDIGIYTLHYIKLFCKNYLEVLSQINSIDELSKEDFYDVNFLKQEDMREELYNYLRKYGWPNEKLQSIKTQEKVNTSRDNFSYREYYTPETKELVYRKEELIFRLFPNYVF